MGPFGDRLKRERELRGISLDEISGATKIGTRSLQALEEEDFAKLPGGVFNRGFVRAYAKFLGINPEEAVSDYLEAAGEEACLVGSLEPSRPSGHASGAPKGRASERKKEVVSRTETDGSSPVAQLRWMPILVFAALFALCAGGVRLYVRHRGHIHEDIVVGLSRLKARVVHRQAGGSDPTEQAVIPNPTSTNGTPDKREATVGTAQEGPAQPQLTPVSPPSTPVPSAAQASMVPGHPAEAAEFTLRIRARELSWISIVADSDPPIRQMLHPGDPDLTVTARQKIKLTVGNAAGFELSLNSKELPALGADHQPRTVMVTADGIQPIGP